MINLDELEKFFWDNYPHEISWAELREANPELYCRLQNAGRALIMAGRLGSGYLED